ncbi:MAG: hypothetical protein Q7R81_00565 [Candidatus Peregrinibacteria bacterium]|nr:hypothetical protein [Candidatus Peregrinibacteria bacterium]
MKSLWFKAKHYGWGWYPATWEGWLVMLVFVLLIVGTSILFDLEQHPERMIPFFLTITALVLALLVICYRTGETPRWRWGKDDAER